MTDPAARDNSSQLQPQAPAPEAAELIETLGELERLAERLRGASRVAVDLESDGFYSYYPKICLVQLSFEDRDFIVDPLAVQDISPLGPLFRDPAVEKVFHAAEYDIHCLGRDYGFRISSLFDTMAASRILGAHELGLASVVWKHFHVRLSKKLQRANWSQRPLSAEHLEYARLDTHFLLPLRDILAQELRQKDRWQAAQEAFVRLTERESAEKPFNPDGFWRLSGARTLSGRGRAVLKEIYLYREKTAAALDKAPFRVLPEALMVGLAAAAPGKLDSLDSLRNARGMTSYLFAHYGQDLVEAVGRGLEADPIDEPPRPVRGPAPGRRTGRAASPRRRRHSPSKDSAVKTESGALGRPVLD